MSAYLRFVMRWRRMVAIVLTVLGFVWTISGCSGGTVRVVPLYATGFQWMQDVDIASRGRWPAHGMRAWIRGEESEEVGVMNGNLLPEPYIDDKAVLGKFPSEYHLAYAARTLLREVYAATHPGYQTPEDGRLVAAVEAADGSVREVFEYEKDRELDIVNVSTRELFEAIPPGANHLAGGRNKVDGILQVMNRAMGGVPEFTLGKGFAGEVGVRFAEGARPWRLSWKTDAPGLIVYQWQVLGKGSDDDDEEAAYVKDRWHEPTTYEKTRFARALHEVVERLVYAREKLGRARAGAAMPLLPVETVGDEERWVAFWSADDGIARFLPLVRPEAHEGLRVPKAVAKRLASCSIPSAARLKPLRYTLSFNVHVTNKGRAVLAYMQHSTLGDRATEACMAGVLQGTQWPAPVASVGGMSAVPAASKLFLADGPGKLPNVKDLLTEIQRGTPSAGPNQGAPGGSRVPYQIMIPLGPVLVGLTIGVTIFIVPRETAPRCADELNPITRRPYASIEECEQVLRLSREEIQRRIQEQIKATQPQAPPAPAPQPTTQGPPPPPQDPPPPRREKPDKCPKIKEEIHYLIYEVRKATTGPRPNGYQGLAKRWEEYATNEGKWGYTLTGELGTKPKNHLAEYETHQKRLQQKLDAWSSNQCKEKGHILPDYAEQYAIQKPQLGPGKPLKPAPTPTYTPATSPGNVPQANKPSK